MPNTIKVSSGKSEVSFAGLQVQPLPFDDEPAALASHVYVPGSDGHEVTRVADAADLIDAVGAGAVVPPDTGSSGGKVVASHGAGQAEASPPPHVSFAKPGTRRLRPIEQLTGISRDRPEIVMVTKFQPAYRDSAGSTESARTVAARANPVGRFIAGQHAARGIRRAVTSHVMSTALARSRPVRIDLMNRRSAVKTELQALGAASTFMLNVVRSAILLRSGLDLRDNVHVVDPQRLSSTSASATRTDVGPRTIPQPGKRPVVHVAPQYNVIDVMARLGYDVNAAQVTFSSTKLWLQLVSDMRNVLRFHSLDLVDASTSTRKKDRSPTALTRVDASYFALRANVKHVPSLNDIKVTSKGDLLAFASSVGAAYTNMYEGPHIKNEEMRLALLTNLLSKELRYSRGLSHELVRKTLKDVYGYTVNQDTENAGLFDAVLGVPGTSVTHVSPDNLHTLTGLAQRRVAQDEVVLTFEADYLDTPEGTFSPGSAYYVDGVLDLDAGKFDPARLHDLRHRFSSAFIDFSRIETGLDLMATGHSFDSTSTMTGKMAALAADPRKLFRYIVDKFVDAKTGRAQTNVSADPLSVVYSEARSSAKLRALLFLLTLARLGRAAPEGPSAWDVIGKGLVSAMFGLTDPAAHDVQTYGHAAANVLADAIRDLMLKKVVKSNGLVPAPAHAGSKDLKISVDGLRDALVKGTKLTNAIDSAFVNVLDAFVTDGKAMISPTEAFNAAIAQASGAKGAAYNAAIAQATADLVAGARTRFSGYKDTMIAMVIFDLVCTVISRYSDMKTAGLSVLTSGSSAGQRCFVVRYTATSHTKSFAEVVTRLEKEYSLVSQAVSVMSTTAQNIAASAGKFADYLTAPGSVKQLAKIVSVVGTGPELNALFTEQQIMLMAASVDDMLEVAQRSNEDLDASGGTDGDEEIRFLDEEDASPGARAVLEAALATSELTVTKGSNKRIIVVGVPVGLGEHLKRKVDLTTAKPGAFRVRQSDIIKIMVHKVDIQMPDVVFYPRSYFFELSRFTVKNSARYLRVLPGCTLDDVVAAVPTRDYGSTKGPRVVFADPKDLPGARATSRKITRDNVAFGDPEHAFMPVGLRADILRNHVISHLMETYIKVLTGVNLSEYHFGLELPPPLIEGDVLGRLIDARVAHVANSFDLRSNAVEPEATSAGMFGHLIAPERTIPRSKSAVAHPTSSDVQGPSRPDVRAMKPDAQNVVRHDARTVSGLTRQMTTMSDPLAVSRRLLMPKQFDRVFHLLVDPDDFEVDVAATSLTAHGQQALAALQANGDIVSLPMSSAEAIRHAQIASHERLRLRPRDHGGGDIAFEKYIVTIEPAYEGTQL